ncbi:hypothetical protein [Dyadobacter arcticus]|uniref:hypothetical protein n=1 Tax=Dyadobacter arcticus TaxID=1078754 RepID=UPI0014201E38
MYLDYLDFYLWKNGWLINSVIGYSWETPSTERPIPHRVFAIDFETFANQQYLGHQSQET